MLLSWERTLRPIHTERNGAMFDTIPSRLISYSAFALLVLSAACGGGLSEPPTPKDPILPVVRFTLPADNSEVAAASTLNGNVYAYDQNDPASRSDDRPIKTLTIYADDVFLATLSGAADPNYPFSWVVPSAEKKYVLKTIAEDSAGNTSEATVSVSAYKLAQEPLEPFYAAMKVCSSGTDRCSYDDPTQMSDSSKDLYGEAKTDAPLSDYYLGFAWTSCVQGTDQGECPGWWTPRDDIFAKKFEDTPGKSFALRVLEVTDIGFNFFGAVRIQKSQSDIRWDNHRFLTQGGVASGATYGDQNASVAGTGDLILELRTVVDSTPSELVTSDTLSSGSYSIKSACSSNADNLVSCVLKIAWTSCAAEFVCPAPGKLYSPHIGTKYVPGSVVSIFNGDARIELTSSLTGPIVFVVEKCGPVDCVSLRKQYTVVSASAGAATVSAQSVSPSVVFTAGAFRGYQNGADIIYKYANGVALRARAVLK